jgi:hypothetical protein
MHWQAKFRPLLPGLVWVCLVLAVAAYGSAGVRNVTDMLGGIAGHSRSMVVVERPSR